MQDEILLYYGIANLYDQYIYYITVHLMVRCGCQNGGMCLKEKMMAVFKIIH